MFHAVVTSGKNQDCCALYFESTPRRGCTLKLTSYAQRTPGRERAQHDGKLLGPATGLSRRTEALKAHKRWTTLPAQDSRGTGARLTSGNTMCTHHTLVYNNYKAMQGPQSRAHQIRNEPITRAKDRGLDIANIILRYT